MLQQHDELLLIIRFNLIDLRVCSNAGGVSL